MKSLSIRRYADLLRTYLRPLLPRVLWMALLLLLGMAFKVLMSPRRSLWFPAI